MSPSESTAPRTVLEVLNTYLETDGVNPKTIEAVAEFSEERHIEAGEMLFRAEKASDHLYIVASGEVDVQYLQPSGMRQAVDTLGPGDFGVWSAVVEPHTTSSIGICRTPVTVVAIEAERLRALCDEDSVFGYHLLRQMARVIRRRLQAARLQIADMETRCQPSAFSSQ
jgi:CRP-like cAMP-binding protein